MRASRFLFTALLTISLAEGAMAKPGQVLFNESCEPGQKVIVGAVGDFLMHQPLQMKGYRQRDFRHQWSAFQKYVEGVDIMYGNLETPTAPGLTQSLKRQTDPGMVFDKNVYTSYPMFNVHPQLLTNIKESGFDIVSTANNHALDRSYEGVEMTIDELERVGLPFTGTRKRGETDRQWYTIVDRKGVRTAWIACAAVHNIRDKEGVVLDCQKDKSVILGLIDHLKQNQVDAIFITPHWGNEDQSRPNAQQVELGKAFLERGALAVLGAHPHVLQPMEKYVTKDGRETFIIYSLANFISFQPRTPNKTTIVLLLGLTKTEDGRTIVNGVRYVPAYMMSRTGNLMDVEVKPIRPQESSFGAEGLAYIKEVLPDGNSLAYGEKVVTDPNCRN